ncbi:uncharacterized protein LOC107849308 [Capsicum annuum]|uniref:uncharacterized protein LOC107849308 n=1 Tax=Capsicum annuum TaxID=4072 RepID=UPI0007BEE884|nr:uncharacterized protein LOC107849308 [Capsicum annuum]
MPSSKKIVIAGDFNRHIGVVPGGYDDVHGGFGFGDRNEERAALLDFERLLDVKKKVEIKKEAYVKLFESKDAEEKRMNWEVYKLANKEAKLVVTAAKSVAFESLYAGLKAKDGEKRLYRLAKAREWKGWDVDQVK